MNSWLSSSITQFACGVVAGVGVFVLATKSLGFFSSFRESEDGQDTCTNVNVATDTNDDNDIPLEDSFVLHEGSSMASHQAIVHHENTETINEISASPDVGNEKSASLVGLLIHIAKDQAYREGFVHRGITCNSCNVGPICGIRYKCVNCINYDVCEVCEPEDCHNRTHVFMKIKYPIPPLVNPKTACLDAFYTGKNENCSSLTDNEIVNLKKKTHFREVEIETLFEQFKTLAPEENGITREAFNQCLGPLGRQNNHVMDRMFLFYDQNEDGIISFEEFVCALSILVKGSQEEKVKYVFEGYDVDKKGYLVYKDFHQMFKAYFNVSIELVRDYIKICEEEMKAAFDEKGDKPVSSVFHAPIPSNTAGTQDASASNLKSLHRLPSDPGVGSNSGAQPMMEAMSQDAIDEMVANVFKFADLNNDGKITLEEFKTWAVLDNTMLAWFDALGTIF